MSGKLSWQVEGADWPHRDSSRFVEAAGFRWHVQIMGRGPVALLAHGTGASTHSWRTLMPLLSERFTTIAPDLPGHGFTDMQASSRLSLPGMARDLASLCQVLDIRPELVIGHSAGAAVLVRMAMDRLIEPNMIVSLNGAFLPFGGVAAQLLSPLAKAMTLNSFVPRIFAWRGRNPSAVRRLIEGTGSKLDAEGERLYGKLVGDPAHVAAALNMMANWDLRPLVRDLPKLRCALLLIAAVNDRAVPPGVAQRVHQLVPHSQLVKLPGLGHLAHEERPEAIADIIFQAAASASDIYVK